MVLAAATGAVIGGVVVMALAWTLRVLAEPASAGVPGEARRVLRLHWSVKAAIIVLSIAAYGYLGYSNRSLDKEAPPPVAETAPAALAPPPQAQFDVGGVALRFDPPAGYCLYPDSMLQTVVAQQGKINPDNVVHTVFGNCDQLREAAAKQARIRDYGMLMTPRAQLAQPMDKPELDRIVASAVEPGMVKETLEQRLREAQSRLKLQSFSTLGILQRDKDATYFAYLFKTDGRDGGFAQACVMALTAMKGRLVSYYLYADYSRDARAALLGLLQKVKAGLGDFALRNG